MGVTAAGITGGEPRGFTAAERTITERVYGIAPTTMQSRGGLAGDTWSAYIAFTWPSLFVLMQCWTNNIDVALSTDGGATYKNAIEVDANSPQLIPFTATGFRVRNAIAGNVARYEITPIGTGF